ncbi:Glycosyltransferase family 28, N-terminal domain [Dillenia turbinata]|uniref:Glycosyltransferase family 28, N-terminal domain n=1 Tax=Dillenia turbinata TaxID=194707 RepID=A0AAN8VP32_9MAGN
MCLVHLLNFYNLQLKLLNRIATVKDDGTVEFEVPADVEPRAVGARSQDVYSDVVDDEPLDAADLQYIPPLQIVMLIVGTRGDVQPFIAIGKRLQEFGHRVRLATHSNFKEFVLTAGLEFFPLGGDPKVLAGCKYQRAYLISLNLVTVVLHYFMEYIVRFVVLFLSLEWYKSGF